MKLHALSGREILNTWVYAYVFANQISNQKLYVRSSPFSFDLLVIKLLLLFLIFPFCCQLPFYHCRNNIFIYKLVLSHVNFLNLTGSFYFESE